MAEAQSALTAVTDMEDAARISDYLKEICSKKMGAYLR
jgi:hypothetical protein